MHSCWTLEDARSIIARAQPGAKVVLMGAGFIGCIILEALVRSGVSLTVIEMEGWRRTMLWDETGLTWVNPSPNMRNSTQALLYPGVGLIED